jgi:hypothetical protein
MYREFRAGLALVLTTSACVAAVFAPAASAAPPPLDDMTVSASCSPNPVQGGQFITCDWGITNTGTQTQTCTVQGTMYEQGRKEVRTVTGVVLAGGQSTSGRFEYRTDPAPPTHRGKFDLRVTCSTQNGKQTTEQVSFSVVP